MKEVMENDPFAFGIFIGAIVTFLFVLFILTVAEAIKESKKK